MDFPFKNLFFFSKVFIYYSKVYVQQQNKKLPFSKKKLTSKLFLIFFIVTLGFFEKFYTLEGIDNLK